MKKILCLISVASLTSGCAELQRMHEEQVARDCQPSFAQQRGQRDGAYGHSKDTTWFNAYCPPYQQQAAVQAYNAGYHSGMASRPQVQPPVTRPQQPQTQPPTTKPSVQPPVVLVVPERPAPNTPIVVPDYNDWAARQVTPQEPIVVPEQHSHIEVQPPIATPNYNEWAEHLLTPEAPIAVPDYNQLAEPEQPSVIPQHGEWAQTTPEPALGTPEPLPLLPQGVDDATHFADEPQWPAWDEAS